MRVRTFLVVALWLGVIFALASLFLDNVELIQRDFRLWGGSAVRVGWILLGSFVVGFALSFAMGLSREIGLQVERWRMRKAERKSEEIEEEYSRGLVAVLEGRDDEALAHFRAVLERDSRHFNTLIKLGEVLRGQGRHAEAIEYHRKAHHLKDDSTRPLYALVEDHEAMGDMDRARAVLGKIIAINRNSVAAWRKLRALHVKEGNWEKANEAQQRVVKLGSGIHVADRRFGPGIRYEIAKASLAQGRAREAIAGLRRLLKEDDTFIPAHLQLGHALVEADQEEEGLAAWHRGFERTGSPIFLTALEEHHLRHDQPLAAIEALKNCIARVQRDLLARFYLGKLYFRLEMLDDAMAVLVSLEGRAGYAPTLHYLLGRIHERRQKFRQAAEEYRKVIREMELVQLDYVCRRCSTKHVEWSDRCSSCGEWNAIEVDFREEISLEELGLAPAPIYSARD